MKKIFNNHIFKDKSFIKMVCFTIVLLLVLVLGNSFGYVSAEGTSSDFLNNEDYQSSSVYASNNVNVRFINSDENSLISSSLILSHDYNFSNTPSGFDYDNISSYLIIGSGYPSEWVIYFFEGECHCYIDSLNRYTVLCGESTTAYSTVVTSYGNGTNLVDPYCIFSDSLNSISLNYDTNMFYQHYLEISGSNSNVICMTNMDILTTRGLPSNSTIYQTVKDYLDGLTNTNIVNVNYLYGNVPSLNGFDNLEGVEAGSDGGMSASNAMYVDSADWVMNNYSTDLINNWKSISVMFTSNLNQYIRDNYDNDELEDFYITYDFVVDTYFYYYALNYDDLGSGDIQFAKGLVTIGYNAPLSTTSQSKFKFACTYKKTNSNTILKQSVASFIEGGNSHVFSLNTIFPLLTPSGKLEISYDQDQDPTNNNGTSYSQDIEFTLPELMSKVSDGTLHLNNNSFSSFKLTCKATINYGNMSTNEALNTSGSYIETFDLLTGESTVDDSSMLTNYNPYNSNNAESYDVIPSSGSGTSTSSASTGNVTQTVTVTNSGAEYIPSLVSKLIPTSLGDTGTGLVDTFSTMVQSNGWISVMASTVPAIPAEMWTYMTTYLGITLYLLACAFVLRLILDLL